MAIVPTGPAGLNATTIQPIVPQQLGGLRNLYSRTVDPRKMSCFELELTKGDIAELRGDTDYARLLPVVYNGLEQSQEIQAGVSGCVLDFFTN